MKFVLDVAAQDDVYQVLHAFLPALKARAKPKDVVAAETCMQLVIDFISGLSFVVNMDKQSNELSEHLTASLAWLVKPNMPIDAQVIAVDDMCRSVVAVWSALTSIV